MMTGIIKRSAVAMFSVAAVLSACKQRAMIVKNDQGAALAPRPVKPVVKYMLPDGRLIGADKLDSVVRVWGQERLMTRHNADDDTKGIIHLDTMSKQMMATMKANSAAGLKLLEDMVGHPALDFMATDMKGEEIRLADLKGKVVVVNFWFTTCPPCIAEMPELNKLVGKYAGRDVVFLGITFNDVNAVSAFLNQHKFNYTILPKATDAIREYGVHNYPLHLVIGKDGNLKQFFLSGEHIDEQLSKVIDDQIS